MPFLFTPRFLRPSELVLYAALRHLDTDGDALPPRPPLRLPRQVMVDGKPYVVIHKLFEPVRTGFIRRLLRSSEPPIAHAGARDGIAPMPMFLKFLAEAV